MNILFKYWKFVVKNNLSFQMFSNKISPPHKNGGNKLRESSFKSNEYSNLKDIETRTDRANIYFGEEGYLFSSKAERDDPKYRGVKSIPEGKFYLK